MPTHHPFERTLRSLEGDGFRRGLAWAALTVAFLSLWVCWLLFASVPVYVPSRQARLEVARDAFRIEARVGGQVERVVAEVGKRVAAGDVLFELDVEVERLRLQEERARIESLRRQLATARAELDGWRAALAEARRSHAAEQEEVRAQLAAAGAAADLAAAEAERAEHLLAEGLIPRSEVERLRSVAEQLDQEREAAGRSLERLGSGAVADEREREAELAMAQREIARLEGELAAATEVAERLYEELDQRTVRAPADGLLAEVGLQRGGGLVEAGQHLATLVPTADLLVVATFDPARALGRIAPGQPAEVRLEGFPWTEFGSLEANVLRVAGEPRDGAVRVELTVADGAEAPVPLTHGLPGTVLVRVDRTSPISLVLRAVGQGSRDTGPRSPAAAANGGR